MIEIYKTNITNYFDALKLKEVLLKEFPKANITFDLQSNDKILRTEGNNMPANRVIQIIKHQGFYCQLVEEKQE